MVEICDWTCGCCKHSSPSHQICSKCFEDVHKAEFHWVLMWLLVCMQIARLKEENVEVQRTLEALAAEKAVLQAQVGMPEHAVNLVSTIPCLPYSIEFLLNLTLTAVLPGALH